MRRTNSSIVVPLSSFVKLVGKQGVVPLKNEKIIGSLIFIVFAGLFFILTFDFPTVGQPKDVGPGFMPKVYASFLVFFSLILLFQGIKEKTKKENESDPLYQNMKIVVGTMILTIIYVFLIPYLGFYLISIIFMIIFLKFTKVKSVWTIIFVSLGTNLFIFTFFEKLLNVPVPTGLLFS